MRRLLTVSACLALAACTGVVSEPGTGGGSGGAGGTGGAAGGGGATGGGAGGGTASGSGCEALALVTSRCASCHGRPPSQGAPISLDTLAALAAASTSTPGLTNAQRSLQRLQDGSMPPVPLAPGTSAEAAILDAWINAGMPACASPDGGSGDAGAPIDSSPNLIPQAELFQCTGALSDAPTRLRRLNRWEWTRDVGGSVTRSWTGFSFYDNPFDPSAFEPYSTWASDETLDDATVELFLPIVSVAGPQWAGPYAGANRLQRLYSDATLQCMFNDAHPTAACVHHFLSEFLTHGVLFRPPSAAELSHLEQFTTTVMATEDPDGGSAARTHSITRISNAAWLTTGALFRSEFGGAEDGGRVALTDWELAQQLAYAIGARAPGATPTWVYPDFSAPLEGHLADFAGAAADGGLRNPGTIDALFRANAGGVDATRFDLLQDYRVEQRTRRGEYWQPDGLANFFRNWLGYTTVDSIFKERPEATSQFDDGSSDPYRHQLSSYGNLMSGYYGYESTLIEQMDDVVGRLVVSDVKVLENLLTSRQFFLASTANPASYGGAVLYTGEIYGTEQAIADTNSARWVMLPANERAGVLTHPAWLGSHGGNFEDDPSLIHRGKWIRENLLCDYVPPLSQVKVVAMVGPHAADKNARARVDEATASTLCQGCHHLMNPLGTPFEIYNHAGYLRKVDHAKDGGWGPPDGTSTLSGMPDPALDGPVTDAIDLSQKLASSPFVKRCFVRQAFRYFMGRAENRTDACTLVKMEQAYDANNGSFRSMLSALFTSDTFGSRRVPGAGE